MQLQEFATLAEPGIGLRTARRERTPPDASRMIMALRQIGYSFENAIADLVDNSISAKATSVLIRFVCSGEQIRSIIIADNGCGMSEQELLEAMRFGSERDLAPDSLGKYGMGMKLASLSYARCLTVISGQGRKAHGRRWTIRGIERGWNCEVVAEPDAVKQMGAPWGPLDLATGGTIVIWDDLDKLATSSAGLRPTLRALARRLELHLGLCFHRFLEGRKLAIFLDQQTEGNAQHSIHVEVMPLNPFAYPASGRPDYPKKFRTSISGLGEFHFEGHIWPPNSELPQYKLGNKAAARQGFYFYRNGRLIQSGGWNGFVQHETDPHSSLARVKVDLPPELDSTFGLNVQKSAVIVPPGFDVAVALARAADGDLFEAYRRAAQQLYRHKDSRAKKTRPLIPVAGLPKSLARMAKAALLPAGDRAREVGFEWKKLASDDLFQLDRKRRIIFLNSDYRQRLLAGRHASRTDLPLLKTMLFLLIAEHFDADRISGRQKHRLELANELLTRAATLMQT